MADLDFYYPFDSINGDRAIVAATERRFFGTLFNDGVVGSESFAASEVSAGVYRVAPGVAIVAGAIGGNSNAQEVEVGQTNGAKKYIVLRLNTNSDVRSVALQVVDSPATATADELDAGAVHDLVLYEVENNGTTGVRRVKDARAFCASFDAGVSMDRAAAAVEAINASAADLLSALSSQHEAAINEANAENAGLYGSLGRQGFINPTFNVNQRGKDAYEVQTGAVYTFDRWLLRSSMPYSGTAFATVTRELDGDRQAVRIKVPAVSAVSTASAVCFSQAIERGVRAFCRGGKSFTVSFDAKASEAAMFAVEPVQYMKTGEAGVTIKAQAVELGTEWRRYSLTFQGSSVPAIGDADLLKIGFYPAWSGHEDRFGHDGNGFGNLGGTVWLANMQINEGAAALPCYVPPFPTELEQCRRYFIDYGYVSLAPGRQLASNKTFVCNPIPLPTMLAHKPTVTVKDNAGNVGKGSLQTTGGVWHSNLAVSFASVSQSLVTPIITATDTSAVVRAQFSSVEIDAEFYD